jgi:hypothetical protein
LRFCKRNEDHYRPRRVSAGSAGDGAVRFEKSWFALAREFVSRNHDVTIISRVLPQFARHEIVDGVRHIRVRGFDTPRSVLWLKILDLFYSSRVRRALPAAILVTNTFWLPLLIRDASRVKIYVHVARYPKVQMRLYGRAARLQTPSSEVADAIKGEAPSSAHKVIAIPYPRPQRFPPERRCRWRRARKSFSMSVACIRKKACTFWQKHSHGCAAANLPIGNS